MGLSRSLTGRVYVDANFIIYLVQGFPEFRQSLDESRDSLVDGIFQPVTSEFTLCEVLVRPMQRGDPVEVARYRSLLLDSGAFELVSISSSTFIEAARLRAELALKTPDAIHVAAALEAGCQLFLSNDGRLRLPVGLTQVRPA